MKTNEILRIIFEDQDCTITEFAKRVKMKRTSSISLWLNDENPLSFEKLQEMCEFLNYKLKITLEDF
jgi:transcriptional regulator with XRE-family HTH domain